MTHYSLLHTLTHIYFRVSATYCIKFHGHPARRRTFRRNISVPVDFSNISRTRKFQLCARSKFFRITISTSIYLSTSSQGSKTRAQISLRRPRQNEIKYAVRVIFDGLKGHVRPRKALVPEAQDAPPPYDNFIFMSKQPHENVNTVATSLKRKRASMWPYATRVRCKEVLASLTTEGILQELSPSDAWCIIPGTTRGKV